MQERLLIAIILLIGATARLAVKCCHVCSDVYIKLTSKPILQRQKDVASWLTFDECLPV